MDTILIDSTELRSLISETFQKHGFPENVAETSAENLVKADLRGIDSHGVARLTGYIRLVKAGRINVNANPTISRDNFSVSVMDADAGLGLWTAKEAMKIAIEKADKYGSGWVSVNNSTHFGIAAAHAEMAIEKDMIGMAMTNASPLVAPAGGTQAYLGTNPICVAMPAGKYPPFILDMATAAAANGKLEIAERKGAPIPKGWAQTASGEHTVEADALKKGGTLLPLGSHADGSYHKGYGLGSLVDIMSGVLSGANFGIWVPPFVSFLDVNRKDVGKGIGHFLGAWRIDAFEDAHIFKSRMEKWIEGVKNMNKAEGIDEILIPGEPEYRIQQQRLKEGIPVSKKLYEELFG